METIKDLKNFLESLDESKPVMVYHYKKGWIPFDSNGNSEHEGKIYLGLPKEY